MNRIDNISQHESLSIATYYGRITINDVWYRYDAKQDCLIRESELPSQQLLGLTHDQD
jgi:hypothetical protein